MTNMRSTTLLVLLLLFCVESSSDAAVDGSTQEILRRTLPAYGLANVASSYDGPKSQCKRELAAFRRAVDEQTLWGLRMLDSSGEPKPGFIYGNNYWFGSRSQCLDVMNKSPLILKDETMKNNSRLRDAKEEFPPYSVNYFVAYFRHNSTVQYQVRLPNEDLVSLGLCLPASCSTVEIGFILTDMFRNESLTVGKLYSADLRLVEVKDLIDDHRWLLDPRMLAINCILIILLVLLSIGTTYDVLVYQKRAQSKKARKPGVCENNNIPLEMMKLHSDFEQAVEEKWKPGVLGKILLCFSIYSNTKMIFNTKLSGDSVAAIHGMRFLGMMWIIMIHTIFYMTDVADNKPWSWRVAEGFAVQIISNSTLSVDTFFFLSGFLLAYLYFIAHRKIKQTKQNCGLRSGEFIVTILRRFIRLTPAYMMMVGIIQLNSSWYAKTSQFYMTERPHETCEIYWWRNILYINNLFGRDTMCLSWSWYISNDMQFFIIGTFLLILSSMFFYMALTITLLLLISSIAVTGYISYINNYSPTMDQQYHMLDVLYDPPWTRIGPHLVGIITAYIFTRLNGKLELKTRTVALGWILGSSCNIVVLFGLYEKQIPVLSAAFYVALSRTVWAIGLAWIIIACGTKHGGIVNKVLSFKAWIPLSRLTYCAYLLNPFIISSIYLHSESAVHVDFLPNGVMFLGNLVATYVCSYVMSLMLETPIVLLMRTFIKFNKRSNEPSQRAS